MKSSSCLLRLLFISLAGMLLDGCLSKPVIAPIRHFVLAPMAVNENEAINTGHSLVAIARVKMPSYLLRDFMAIRKGTNEVEYSEDAQWAERLDQCFQRTLTGNLSRLLPSSSIYIADSRSDPAQATVFIDVQQFDVDIHGHGTLMAEWRIVAADGNATLKSGRAKINQTGVPPRNHPEAIAATLSNLTAEFSRELAKSIQESETASP